MEQILAYKVKVLFCHIHMLKTGFQKAVFENRVRPYWHCGKTSVERILLPN
jgi:hypothetical protein